MDLLIDPTTGDLFLDERGQILLTRSELEATAQRLRVKFRFFRGEWFLDRRQGTPWFQRILRKGSNERVNRSIFRQIIEGDPGVASVLSLRYSLTRASRSLRVDFVARLKSGEILDSRSFAPFLVDFS